MPAPKTITTPKTASAGTGVNLNPSSHPLPSNCYGGPRSANQIKIIVLHDSEIANGPGDLGALYNALNGQGLSVHAGNDGAGNCVRFVDDEMECFHCVSYNSQSLGIEQIGFSTQANWPEAQINNTSEWVAYWANKFNIPLTHSTIHGICTHSDLGTSGGGHTDPGPNYPFNEVLKRAGNILGKVVIGGGPNDGTPTSTSGGGVDLSGVEATAKASAFATYLELPGILDSAESVALKGVRSLMNDQPLLPFIEQLSQASMRRFQSMPNGNFFAFYPDYFGGMNHRTPYWEIADIEIMDGQINLSDDGLATHVYVVGDTVGMYDGVNLEDEVASAGVVTLFEAMAANFLTGLDGSDNGFPKAKSKAALKNKDEVISFLQRYGARPYFEEAPMIRSGFYEMFLAFQRFCMLWSQQFLTQFTFTYMPELFPGGIVALPDHGIQLFVEEVEHQFDYEQGFTTTAMLSSPAALKGSTDTAGVHEGMVRAGVLDLTSK